jgi:hypothetical protein
MKKESAINWRKFPDKDQRQEILIFVFKSIRDFFTKWLRDTKLSTYIYNGVKRWMPNSHWTKEWIKGLSVKKYRKLYAMKDQRFNGIVKKKHEWFDPNTFINYVASKRLTYSSDRDYAVCYHYKDIDEKIFMENLSEILDWFWKQKKDIFLSRHYWWQTQKEIGERYGITGTRVQQILIRSANKLLNSPQLAIRLWIDEELINKYTPTKLKKKKEDAQRCEYCNKVMLDNKNKRFCSEYCEEDSFYKIKKTPCDQQYYSYDDD